MRSFLFSIILGVAAGVAVSAAESASLPKIKGKIDPSHEPDMPFTSQLAGVPVSEQPGAAPAPFDNAAKVWTLPELIDEALKRNPNTVQAWELANAAAADVKVARSAYYPTVTVGANGGASHTTTPLFPGTETTDQFTAATSVSIKLFSPSCST
jgi:hypothetical protein